MSVRSASFASAHSEGGSQLDERNKFQRSFSLGSISDRSFTPISPLEAPLLSPLHFTNMRTYSMSPVNFVRIREASIHDRMSERERMIVVHSPHCLSFCYRAGNLFTDESYYPSAGTEIFPYPLPGYIEEEKLFRLPPEKVDKTIEAKKKKEELKEDQNTGNEEKKANSVSLSWTSSLPIDGKTAWYVEFSNCLEYVDVRVRYNDSEKRWNSSPIKGKVKINDIFTFRFFVFLRRRELLPSFSCRAFLNAELDGVSRYFAYPKEFTASWKEENRARYSVLQLDLPPIKLKEFKEFKPVLGMKLTLKFSLFDDKITVTSKPFQLKEDFFF